MKYWVIGVLLVVLAAAGYFYLKPIPTEDPPAPPPAVAAAPEPEPDSPPVETGSAETGPALPDAPPAPTVEDIPLPMLTESDPVVLESLDGLIGEPNVTRFIASDNVISRLVTTVDALGSRQVPAAIQGVQGPEGNFGIIAQPNPETVIRNEQGDPIPQFVMDPANADRYTPFVDMLVAVDTGVLIEQYRRHYPLIQEAYRMQGYPDGDFSLRLTAVIDELLATPRVDGPLRLIKPEAYYLFSDPELEALTAGQKILLRMGDANAERVQAKLREIRSAL